MKHHVSERITLSQFGIPVIKATLAINNKPSNITKYTSEIRLMSNLIVFFCCYTSCSAKSTSFCLYCSLAAPVNVIYGLWWTDLLLPLLILYTFASSRMSLIVLCSWGFSVWSINVIQMYCVDCNVLLVKHWPVKFERKEEEEKQTHLLHSIGSLGSCWANEV